MYYEAATNQIMDSYADVNAKPVDDVCQDWELGAASQEDGQIILEVSRRLVTGDEQDWPLLNDTDLELGTAIVAAWGDTPSMLYHADRKAKKHLFLFPDHDIDKLRDLRNTPGLGVTDLVHVGFEVPGGIPSFYGYWCVNLKQAMGIAAGDDAPRHVIAYEAILDAEQGEHLHHVRVFAYEAESVLLSSPPFSLPLLRPTAHSASCSCCASL